MLQKTQKIIVIVGPTASGKSEKAIKIAKKYNGEIISADSRQVYIGMDIGTGKVEGKWQKVNPPAGGQRSKVFTYKSVPHYCIDFVSPNRQYTVANFKRDGQKAINYITSRNKTAVICGGTGQYVDALIFDTQIPEVIPNPQLREKLEKKSTDKLFAELLKKDPVRAATIDRHNKRRLIRALEIIFATGKPIPQTSKHLNIKTFKQDKNEIPLQIVYLNPKREILYKKIEARLKERVKQGMLKEILNLHKKGLSWKRMENLGLEYRYASRYLLSKHSALSTKSLSSDFLASPYYEQLLIEIKHYSKRQQTWFKKYRNYFL